MPINWEGAGRGRLDGRLNVLTLFCRRRRRVHHMQQEFQVLTAKIGGLEGEKTKTTERPEELLANQFPYLLQSANEVIKIKVVQKEWREVNRADAQLDLQVYLWHLSRLENNVAQKKAEIVWTPGREMQILNCLG